MRTAILTVLTLTLAGNAFAQPVAWRSPVKHAKPAETAIQAAMEQLGRERKIVEREVLILKHLQVADDALTDPMQPSVSVQKAFDEVAEAKRLESTDIRVRNGVVEALKVIDDARKSPTSADFGRLRSILRTEATGPATRYALRITAALQEETIAWLRVQRLIGDHLAELADIEGGTLQTSMR
ncbi:MAG: hypothetical protein ACYC7A_17140 [Thermoanaerobaculia bacterium]